MSNENRVAPGISYFSNAILLKFGALCLIPLAVKNNKTRKRYTRQTSGGWHSEGYAR